MSLGAVVFSEAWNACEPAINAAGDAFTYHEGRCFVATWRNGDIDRVYTIDRTQRAHILHEEENDQGALEDGTFRVIRYVGQQHRSFVCKVWSL